MTPSRNTRSYTLRSIPSSPGRSFLSTKLAAPYFYERGYIRMTILEDQKPSLTKSDEWKSNQFPPFWGPRGPRWASESQIWSQLPPIGPPGLDSWSPHTSGGSKRARFGPKWPFWAKLGSWPPQKGLITTRCSLFIFSTEKVNFGPIVQSVL